MNRNGSSLRANESSGVRIGGNGGAATRVALRKEKWGQPCGRPHSHRRVGSEERFTPDVFDAGSDRPLRATEGRLRCRPALAPVPVPSGSGADRKDLSFHPAVPRPMSSAWASNGAACPKVSRTPRRQAGNSGLSDFAPSRLQRVEMAGCRSSPISSLTARHLAVASNRFQNPFFLAGLSAFVSEGPIPVSMSERCAVRPIRATAEQASYPLLARMPVDKAG